MRAVPVMSFKQPCSFNEHMTGQKSSSELGNTSSATIWNVSPTIIFMSWRGVPTERLVWHAGFGSWVIVNSPDET